MGRIYILYVFVERIYILYLFVGRIYMLVGICWKNILYYPLGGWKDGQEESYGLPFLSIKGSLIGNLDFQVGTL